MPGFKAVELEASFSLTQPLTDIYIFVWVAAQSLEI